MTASRDDGSARSISRRTMLALTGSAAVAAAIPAVGAHQEMATTTKKVAWAVGTPGEMDWMHIAARDAEAARRLWVSEMVGGDGCEIAEEIAAAGGLQAYLDNDGEPPMDDCDCDWCRRFSCGEATRVPAWDGRRANSITSADWLKAGMGATCSRCGSECSEPEGTGHPVRCEAICDDCMTLADWTVVDPERAAELEAEMADKAGRATLAAQPLGGDHVDR